MSDYKQYLIKLQNAKGPKFDEQHRKLQLKKLKYDTLMRSAVIEKKREQTTARFALKNKYDLDLGANDLQSYRMNYLH